jgi:hypothetical protein
MSDAIEHAMHYTLPELTQIAANYAGFNPNKVPKRISLQR